MAHDGGLQPEGDARAARPFARGVSFGGIYLPHGKRLLDVVLALLGLVAAFPVMLVIGLLVARDGGPALYGHDRIGRNRRQFRCLKFRTMHIDSATLLAHLLETDPEAAREWSQDHKLTQDPRVTRLGHFLRRTSLDELPQLINVLRGDMSLVGPRPITEEELPRYHGHVGAYLSLRPGLTGFWQVYGRGRVGYGTRVEMDAFYHRTVSFAGDIWLMVLTAFVVFQSRGQ